MFIYCKSYIPSSKNSQPSGSFVSFTSARILRSGEYVIYVSKLNVYIFCLLLPKNLWFFLGLMWIAKRKGIWPSSWDACVSCERARVWLPALVPDSRFLLMYRLGGSRWWLKQLHPCQPVGDLDGALGSQLQPSPVLVATVFEVQTSTWELCLCLSKKSWTLKKKKESNRSIRSTRFPSHRNFQSVFTEEIVGSFR